MKNKVSVLISTYNESIEWIKQSLDSILNQSYDNLEIIIVNDNPSRVDLRNLLMTYEANYINIKLICNPTNLGLISSLNVALAQSSGEFICRMDADDICNINRISAQVTCLKTNPKYDLIGSSAIFINEYGEQIGSFNVISNPYLINLASNYYNPMIHPTWLFRRKVYEKIHKYHPILHAEDYYFILSAINLGFVLYNLSEPLIYFRVRQSSVSNSNGYFQKKISSFIQKNTPENALIHSQNYIDTINENINNQSNEYLQYLQSEKAYRTLKGTTLPIKVLGLTYTILKSNILRDHLYKYIIFRLILMLDICFKFISKGFLCKKQH